MSGMQGLIQGSSVSKYCLQHSPIPVIVVRPSPKREEKKNKRLADPSRRTYNHIRELSGRNNHGTGWLDASSSNNSSASKLPDEEAAVAEALGLPASYNSVPQTPSSAEVVSSSGSTTDEGDGPQSVMWNSLDEAVKRAHAAGEFDQESIDNESIGSSTIPPARSPDSANDSGKLTPVPTNESSGSSTIGPDASDREKDAPTESGPRSVSPKPDETSGNQETEGQRPKVDVPSIVTEDTSNG